MQQLTTEEGNRLIAEFLGWDFRFIDNDYGGAIHAFFNEQKKWVDSPDFLTKILTVDHGFAYHINWNKLMPVVEKIEQGNYGFKMCRKVIEIYFDDSKEVILKVKEKSRLESLWQAVVQFIIWYNTQKQ